MADDQPDAQTAALMAAHQAAGRWIATRFPDMPAYVGAYLAVHITKIVFPFVKVAVHADMADALWAKGMGDVARVLEDNAHQFLDELTGQHEEEHHDVAVDGNPVGRRPTGPVHPADQPD